MDRSIVYLFRDSSWMYGVEFDPKFHKEKGDYHEVIIGKGWSSREVSEMLKEYYNENSDILFKAVC